MGAYCFSSTVFSILPLLFIWPLLYCWACIFQWFWKLWMNLTFNASKLHQSHKFSTRTNKLITTSQINYYWQTCFSYYEEGMRAWRIREIIMLIYFFKYREYILSISQFKIALVYFFIRFFILVLIFIYVLCKFGIIIMYL